MATSWQVGFASADITPSHRLDLAGFAAREQPSIGVHDSLAASAVAIRDGRFSAVMATVDLIGVDADLVEEVRSRVRAELGDTVDYVAVAATHTHGAPTILRRALLGSVNEEYRSRVIEAIASATASALDNATAAQLRFGLGVDSTVGHNRRDPLGPTDPDLPVLTAFNAADGTVLGTLCSYACHPVTVGPSNRLVTRDYPGYVVDLISHATGGAPTLFATGCCGQINTGHSAMDSILGQGFEKRTHAEARRIGTTLAGAALHTLGRTSLPAGIPDLAPTGPLRVGRRQIELPIVPASRPTSEAIRQLEAEVRRLEADPDRRGEAVMAQAHATWAHSYNDSVQSVRTEIGAITLGEVAILFLPGEIFVEMGLELKERFPEVKLITVSYANDAIGYVPHRTAFSSGGYEVEMAYRHYSLPGPYSESAGEVLVDEAAKLLGELLR